MDKQAQEDIAGFRPIPELTSRAQFSDDALAALLKQNYQQVKTDIDTLLADELDRIGQYSELTYLLVATSASPNP